MKKSNYSFFTLLLLGSFFSAAMAFGQGEKGSALAKADRTGSALNLELYGKGGQFEGLDASREILDKRTKYAKHFRNPDGTVTMQTGNVYHYKDKHGKWSDISVSLQPSGKQGYSYANESNDFKTYFPEKPGVYPVKIEMSNGSTFTWWQNPSISIFSNGQILQTIAPTDVRGVSSAGENPPVKNTVTYPNVYNGISEEFVMLKNGIENNTIVHSLTSQISSLPKGAIIQFRQFIPLQNGWKIDVNGAVKTSDFDTKHFHIQIPGSETGISFSPVVVFDHSITKGEALYLVGSPAEKLDANQKEQKKRSIYECDYRIDFVAGGIEISTLLPADWLKANGRQFPVTIDPTVTFTPSGATGDYYAPTSNWYGYQRHANLYLASEIGISNIVISDIEYNRTNTNGTNAVCPYEVYLKTTTASTLSGTAAWNSPTYIGGLTPSFSGSIDLHGTTSGWKMITLATPFVYAADNLMVMVKDAYGGSGSTKYMNRASGTSVNDRQASKRQDNTDPGDGTSTAVEDYLPEIRLTYTFGQACSGQPLSGTISGPASGAVCGNAPFTLSSAGTTVDGGMVYDWQYNNGGGWATTGGNGLSYTEASGISIPTSYRLIVYCQNSNLYDTSNVIALTINPFYNCYCTPVSGCTGEGIENVTFGAINNSSSRCANTNGYEDFGSLGSLTTVTQGQQVPISVTAWINSNPAGAGVWIDYDHNGTFDTTEFTLIGTTSSFTGTAGQFVFSNSVTIDLNALTGITRMRVRSANSTTATQISKHTACLTSNAYGEYEDYLITIAPAASCTGTPNAVTASTPSPSVCASSPFNISTVNATTGIGMIYEWQYDDGNGWQTLLDINSVPVSSFNYTVPGITVPTSFRFLSTCSNGGGNDISNTISLTLNNFISCYCIPTGGANATYGINNFFTTGGWTNISNLNSGPSTGGYHDYSNTMVLTTSVGSIIDIGGSGMGTGTYGWAVFVDWNQNGSFADAGELMFNTTSYTNALPANTSFTVPATALPGNTKMRIIANYNNSNPSTEYCSTTTGSAEWEDYMVNITTAPSCLPPTSLTVTNISSSGADLSWTENNGAGAWYVEYGPSPLTPGTGTILTTSSNPVAISGLSDNTDYQFYVRSICTPGVDTSLASVLGSFRTLCNPITALPWTETFESASSSLPCWQVIDGNSDGDQWALYTTYPHGGANSIGLYTDGNGGNNSDWLVSPGITLNGNQRLKYWYRVRSASEPNDYRILLSNATADTLDFTTVLKPLTTVSNTTYQEDIIDLTGITGTVYLAFHVPAGGLDGWYLYVDDVTVENIPTCPAPATLSSANVTPTSADLAWIEAGSAMQWQIQYGPSPLTLGNGLVTSLQSSNPYSLSGLSQGTTYEFYVRSYCSPGDTSAWSTIPGSFTTLITCPTPTGSTSSNATASSVDLGWTSAATQFEVDYSTGKSFAAGTGTRLTNVTANPITVSGLAPGEYSYFVRAICGPNDTSAWSTRVIFAPIPPNDDCSNAIDISNGMAVNGYNISGTQSQPSCNPTTTNAYDVWYTFTTGSVAGNVTVEVNTTSTGMDAMLEVFDGTCGTLVTQTATSAGISTNLNCIDGPAAGLETATYAVLANTTYYVRVYGFNTTPTGTFSIQVTGSPLTIKLGKITATNVGASNRVDWNTFGEAETDKFELQRSAEGINFHTIGYFDAHGKESRYTYMDNAPVKGYNYYRLLMKEASGKGVYSQTVRAFVKTSRFSVEAFPNPVSHDLTVRATGVNGNATIQITDVTGKIIKIIMMNGSEENINMSELANGIYLIKYVDASHTETIRVNKL